MNALVQTKGRVRLYAAGGCGINIGSQMEKNRNTCEVGFASLDIVYIDTSKSNLNPSIDPQNCYLIDGLDGSGKIRSENHQEISERIRAILHQFKPADLNIVLSSAAGGSGSVIAPLLTSELLESEAPTIVLAVGSADTRLECENTLKTIKSYEAIARMRSAPVTMAYVQNSQTTSRVEADAVLISMTMALCALFSRENKEMDSRDLFNWLRFHRVTSFEPQLAALTMVENKNTFDMNGLGNVISVATLAKEGAVTALASMPEYQCVGYVPDGIDNAILGGTPMHFVTSDGVFPEVANHLTKLLKELDSAQSARRKQTGVLTNSDTPTTTGLVL